MWCDLARLVEHVPSTLKALLRFDPQCLIKWIQRYMPVISALGGRSRGMRGLKGCPQLHGKLHRCLATQACLMQRGKIAVRPRKAPNALSHSGVVPA